MSMSIGLTYDLRSHYLALGYGEEETAEFDCAVTVDAIEAALARLGHRPERIGNVRELAARLVAGQRWDLVFNICEGVEGFGREAQVPALLEAFAIPSTFSDALLACVSLHKGVTKHVLRGADVPTPDFAVVASRAEAAAVALVPPLFVKPVAEGTSKGCDPGSIVRRREVLEPACEQLLARFRQPVLVESYLPGRELTVGVLGTGDRARSLGVLEVALRGGADAGVYSYRNKEHYEELVEYRLATDPVAAEAEGLALAAWRALGGRDAGRVDLRCDHEGRPQVLEANPIPGLNPERSDLPILCGLAGIGYDTLIAEIVTSASARVGSRRRAEAA